MSATENELTCPNCGQKKLSQFLLLERSIDVRGIEEQENAFLYVPTMVNTSRQMDELSPRDHISIECQQCEHEFPLPADLHIEWT